jgi:hypothetical protein
VTLAASSVAVEEALLGLKVLFLVVLYFFIWRIVRSASRDLRVPQESFVLQPQQRVAKTRADTPGARLVVVRSPALGHGHRIRLDSTALTVGRGGQNDVALDKDDFVSARHARFEPRTDGVWVEDVGSTNGTFVNGARLVRPRRLAPGDVVRVGQTDLRLEV